MRYLGIDLQFGDIYQDAGIYYRHVAPPPIVCEAIFDPESTAVFKDDLIFTEMIFREDAFDPVTRLRRGRFYIATGSRPTRCGILPRTTEDYERNPRPRDIFTFAQYQLAPQTRLPKQVALGAPESLWRVVSQPERISTGEFLFTLKARHSFGILPELDTAAVPEDGRGKVKETVAELVEFAYRGLPSSIADQARDAAQWCLATWAKDRFSDLSLFTDELAHVISKIEKRLEQETGKRDTMVALKAVAVLQRFHSRRKSNERERYGSRPPTEADAELALNSIGFLLRELGWARD